MKDIKFDESKMKEYYVSVNGNIYSKHKSSGTLYKMKPMFVKDRGIYIKIKNSRVVVHNVVYENYVDKIPKDKVIEHIDGDPYNCDVYNLRLKNKSNLRRVNNNKDITVVCYNEYLGLRHFKNLIDLTIFLNRDFNKYDELEIIRIFNTYESHEFGDWKVSTCLAEYDEEYPDVVWDQAFKQYDDEDDD